MNTIDGTKKPKKGRPQVDTEAVNLRLPRELVEALDSARKAESDLPNRPEAIRRILSQWLRDKGFLAE
ncbi:MULTISPECIES: ribbon-helix-helix protein, CopG family [Brucella]|uniref:ribbon-helix-helix protein, CopG family n=1 Tax=Brucella inopinata TaxID=1218315 RepID=UPI0009F32B3A